MDLKYYSTLMNIALDRKVSVKTCQGMLVNDEIIRVEEGKNKESKKFFVIKEDLLSYLLAADGGKE